MVEVIMGWILMNPEHGKPAGGSWAPGPEHAEAGQIYLEELPRGYVYDEPTRSLRPPTAEEQDAIEAPGRQRLAFRAARRAQLRRSSHPDIVALYELLEDSGLLTDPPAPPPIH